MYSTVVVSEGIKIASADMCKIMLGTCAPEKVVAETGGGSNYCHNSLMVATSKDNYTDVVGGAMCVTETVCVYVLPIMMAETERENSDTACEVAEVGVDTTTSDNTIYDDTVVVTESTVGCVKIERLGNADVNNTCVSVDSGADPTSLGVPMYLVLTSDSLSKYSCSSDGKQRMFVSAVALLRVRLSELKILLLVAYPSVRRARVVRPLRKILFRRALTGMTLR